MASSFLCMFWEHSHRFNPKEKDENCDFHNVPRYWFNRVSIPYVNSFLLFDINVSIFICLISYPLLSLDIRISYNLLEN